MKAGDLVTVKPCKPHNKYDFRHGQLMYRQGNCASEYSLFYIPHGTILLVTGNAFTTGSGELHISVLHPEFGVIECNESYVEISRN